MTLRHLERWSGAEKRRLRREYTIQLLSIRQIAERHDRTCGSVRRMIEHLNVGRNHYGLKPPPEIKIIRPRINNSKPRFKLRPKKRICLFCGTKFRSLHKGNRLCHKCIDDEEFRYAAAYG